MVFLTTWEMDTIELYEEFKMLLLNTANEVLGVNAISKGGLSTTLVDLNVVCSGAKNSVKFYYSCS